MSIGQRILEARKKEGLTQAQLAEKSGVAAISIHQYESGKRIPRVEQLENLAKALHVDMGYMFGGKVNDSGFITFEVDEETAKALGSGDLLPGESKDVPLNPKSAAIEGFIKDVLGQKSVHGETESGQKVDESPLKKRLMRAFDDLNILGQEKAVERIEELTEIPKYKKQGSV